MPPRWQPRSTPTRCCDNRAQLVAYIRVLTAVSVAGQGGLVIHSTRSTRMLALAH